MKLFIFLALCLIVLTAMPVAHGRGHKKGISKGPDELKNWYKNLPNKKQKASELHFYLHDIVSGPNPTNVPIVVANVTKTSPALFGLLAVIDDPLTSGPSPNSATVGRAQGLVGSASLSMIDYHMTFTIIFTSGKFNGSSLSLAGHNPFLNEFREVPVVGGSGVFRLAQGSALLHTLSFNNKSGDAVVEYNVVVLHY